MQILKAANLALSFLLELCMLAAYAYWGYITGNSLVMQLLLCSGVPAIVIGVWAVFMAPTATRRLPRLPHLGLELVIFVPAIIALYTAEQPALAFVFAAVYAVNVVLRLIWQQ